jgi:hypothetical protein
MIVPVALPNRTGAAMGIANPVDLILEIGQLSARAGGIRHSRPGSTFTEARGINASGQIVGNSSLGAFLLDNGSYTTLDVPASDWTEAQGLIPRARS